MVYHSIYENKSNTRKNEHMFNVKLFRLKTDLQKQKIDAKASAERFRLAQQEFETTKKVLDNSLMIETLPTFYPP